MTKGGWWSASCRKGGQGRRSERGKNSGGGKEEEMQGGMEFGSNLVFSSKIFSSHRSWPKLPSHVTDGAGEEQPRCWESKFESWRPTPPMSCSPHPTPSYSGHRRHQKVHTATNTRLNWPKAGHFLPQAQKRRCKSAGRWFWRHPVGLGPTSHVPRAWCVSTDRCPPQLPGGPKNNWREAHPHKRISTGGKNWQLRTSPNFCPVMAFDLIWNNLSKVYSWCWNLRYSSAPWSPLPCEE